nr:MAG TPA: tail tube protein [Bacteriophage sp.]
MKMFKKIFAVAALSLSMLTTSVAAQNIVGIQEIAQAATIKLNKKSVALDVGKTQKLKVTGTKANVKWSSTDVSVAKVSQSGVVTAVSSGSATIKAKVGKKTLSCKITVKEKINKLVYEDSNIRVYFTGLKKDTYPDELIACLTIENLSGNNLEINNSDSTSINDTMVDATLYQELAPHKKAYVTMFTYDDYAVGLSLNEITDIQTSLVVWDEDSIDSDYYTTEPISLLK